MDTNFFQQQPAYNTADATGGYFSGGVQSNAASSSSPFDVILLVLRVLKYWPWYILALIVALGLAYIKNKSWEPQEKTVTTILIEEKQGFNDMMMGGMSNRSGRNNNNQLMMYRSYDLIKRAVDRMNISTDIYMKTRFKDLNIYGMSPIVVRGSYVSPGAYGLEFNIKHVSDSIFQISFKGNDFIPSFSIQGVYGMTLQHNMFFVTVERLGGDYSYDLYFRFLRREDQIIDYASRLNPQFVQETSVLEVSLIGNVAQRDVDFLNTLNEMFFLDNLTRKNIAAEKTIDFINDQLDIIKDSITSSESKLKDYQQQSHLFSQNRSGSAVSELDELDRQRAEIRLKKEYINVMTDYLKSDKEVLISPSVMGITDPGIMTAVGQYNIYSSELKNLGSESPIYKRNKALLEDLKKHLNESISAMRNAVLTEERTVNGRYAKLQSEAAALPEKERKYLTHERDFKINETYHAYLLQRRIESNIQKESNTADNLVIDQPRTIFTVNEKEKNTTYIMYALIGLLIPLFVVICKEILFKVSIQSRDEVESIAQLPILGTVERSTKKEQIIVKYYPKSSFAESFRGLRSRMEYIVKRDTQISMLVTSTEPKDGKTFIAGNLASIYQLTGRKTILLDSDLRRPALSKALNMGHHRGISNYLIGQVDLDDIIIPHPEYGFDVMPAGTVPPNPSELLRSNRTIELMNELKTRYDYIIIDCSPVGLVSDAHYLAKLVDVALYVVRNEKTNRHFFKYTIAEFREDERNNIVIVYNDVNLRGGYYYGNRRYYGQTSYYVKHDSYYRDEELDGGKSKSKSKSKSRKS